MKQLLYLYLLLISFNVVAQDNSQQWGSYFSYNNIVDIAQSSTRIYAGADNAVFSQNTLNGELKTITSVDGLKAEGVTAMYHSGQFNRTLVGNSNGLLLVINADNSIVTKIDIVQETTIAQSKKRINHIMEFNGFAYLSCDFGITVFNLSTLQFGDTFYLGPNGSEIAVAQSTVINGYIYAATNELGIRRGLLADPNLNDFNQWVQVNAGFWTHILSFNNTLFASDNSNNLYRIVNGNPVFFTSLTSNVLALTEANGFMVATGTNKVSVFNNGYQQVFEVTTIPGVTVPLSYTCATVVSGKIYIGTAQQGVYSIDMAMPGTAINVTPDGPLRSNIFKLTSSPNYLWAVFGGYNFFYTPDNNEYGVSKLTAQGWQSIPYEDLLGARSIVDATVNPNNENEVYFNSFQDGLLKVVDDVPVVLYDEENSPIEKYQNGSYESTRISGGVFDAAGNLWIANSLVRDALKVLRPGSSASWASYNLEDALQSGFNENFGRIVIDKNGTKWMAGYNAGVIAFNETLGEKLLTINQSNGLPDNYIKSLAIDNNNRLWIGTVRGLGVLSGIDRFTTEDELTANPIIIVENGEAQELMYQQVVSDIEVDGSNNKWLGTTGSGAFLVSPDGQSTLFHFTKENSPLPSNNINDIEINNTTGEVFFATDRGMVSYKGTSTAAESDLARVYVYPNPVRPGFDGDVKISGLIDNANIKITDIEGNLVYETTSEGGTVLWDTKAFGKYKVASGVYMIFIASEDGTETKVKKVMVVR